MPTPNIEVLGLGAPIVDQIIKVDEEFLQNVPGEKGGSLSVNYEILADIFRKSTGKHAICTPGGSAANTIVGMASLGSRCGLMGMIGQDEMGAEYRKRLKGRGIRPHLTEHPTEATAQVVSLVTPDGQRTMRSFLGASNGFNASHLKEEQFQGIKLLHCEGYALYNGNGELVREAMIMAKKVGAKISIDLASFEVVRLYKSFLMDLLKNYVDIVFCNEDEAKVIHPEGTIEETADLLSSYCQVAIITLGSKGCLVSGANQKYYCPTTPIPCIDTTGAGDIFASGFLHMYLQGHNLRECCHVAHLLGGAVLRVIGAQLPDSIWEDLLKEIKGIKEKRNSVLETTIPNTSVSFPGSRVAIACPI